MTNRNTAAVVAGLHDRAKDIFEYHRKEMRGAYLRAVAEVVTLDKYTSDIDGFLDVIDVELSKLFVDAGALDNSEMFAIDKRDAAKRIADAVETRKPAPVTKSAPGYVAPTPPGNKPDYVSPSQPSAPIPPSMPQASETKPVEPTLGRVAGAPPSVRPGASVIEDNSPTA